MKYINQIAGLTLGALIFIGCGGGGASAKVLLRFKPQKNKVYNLDIKMDVSGGANGLKNSMDMQANMKVAGIDEQGNVTLDVTYKKLSVDMTMGGQNMHFDSDQPDSQTSQMSTVFLPVKSMIDKPMPMVLDNRCRVVKPLDFTSLIPDSIQRPENDKQFNEAFDQMFTVLPEKEVGEGDTWKDALTTKGEMPMKLDVTYTVEKVEAQQVIIGIVGKGTGEVNAVGNSFDIKGDMTGKIYIDRNTGWTIKVDIQQNYNINMMGNEMKMVTTIKMESK